MKILKVIHGYPPLYNAGSEVYSQTLCHELVKQGHEVVVFTRQENAYRQEYSIEWTVDASCPQIKLCLINMAHSRDGYRHAEVDRAFAILLENYMPDIIHIGHLNHLSTSIVSVASQRSIPMIFTLHDFWLMCPRGQFLQAINSKTEDLYPECERQENEKCARNCYWRYFSSQDDEEDIRYWTHWIDKRMAHVREISSLVDFFVAPSHYLMHRFIHEFVIPPSKIAYLDYGFDRARLQGRIRHREDAFVFGYIGTHKQAKGIFHLLQAFKSVSSESKLKIWGSPLQPFTSSLQTYAGSFPEEIQNRIVWKGGYRNDDVVTDVFDHVDAIIVPSIWGENSPLVIHEALEAGVPVITADYGGMREYIQHEENGLLFKHRLPESLALQMERLMSEKGLAEHLSKRGYLQSQDGHIPDMEEHVQRLSELYEGLIQQRNKDDIYKNKGPLAYHI